MDFDQLATFVEAAKLGSFSRAGEKVFRSQPAVSAQIRQLEEEYGQRLFDRTGKTVRLTPVGEVLFEYAGRMLAVRNESLRAVSDQSAAPKGVLALGANEATCLYVLPDVFAEYSARYPLVQVSVYRNFTRKILERVENGSIDVGIATMPIRSTAVKAQPIFRDRIMLMVSPKNPLAHRRSASIAEIAGQPLIFPATGTTRRLLDKHFRPYRTRMRIVMELPSVSMIKRFVAAGVGVSLISASFAAHEVAVGEARLIPVEKVELWRELALVYRADRTLPRAAAAFIDLLGERGRAKK